MNAKQSTSEGRKTPKIICINQGTLAQFEASASTVDTILNGLRGSGLLPGQPSISLTDLTFNAVLNSLDERVEVA